MDMIGIKKARTRGPLGWLVASALVMSGMTVAVWAPAQAAEPAPDGLSSFTAAASCWEIKQNRPSAADGTYWLVTPTLVAPEQFYCDMTTDGGGWVLIGRGREGWSPRYEGAGTSAQVREVITGVDAFQPRQLSSRVIDGLLDGRRVDQLADGVRVRRASNAGGTAWQEVRFKYLSRVRWAWTFGAEHRLGTWRFGTSNGSGGQTNNFGNNNGLNRLDTRETQAQGWNRGMAFGTQTTGTNSSTTYLWSNTNNAGSAMPFAQMFLRPQLRLADLAFGIIPDSGTQALEQQSLAMNGAKPNPWGVTGLANGRNDELTTEVASFTQIGNTVYVGGNFAFVQKGANATGADKVSQPYLAAFDAVTGNFISSFRPQLNGQVKALAVLPNGLVVAGGDFTTADGKPAAGAVALNASTGAKAPGWDIQVENRLSGGLLQVRSMVVRGNWLYLGGAFTHVSGGGSGAEYSRGAARVRVSDGKPDASWNPAFNGTVVAMDVSADGSKVYAAGYFGTAKDLPAFRAAELSATTASPNQAWAPTWSSSGNYQQAIGRVGSRVWVGGAEHSLFTWDVDSWARLSGSITKQGGDFQTMNTYKDVVYASCHCNDFVYSDAYTWSNVGTGWTHADNIGYVAAWDAETGAHIPDFNPVLNVRRGAGGWATMTDSTGTTWFGGDFTRALMPNGTAGWAGGFVRFAERDITAPTRPGTLTAASNTTSGARLSWGASSGQNRYEVIRDNRVIATTATTSLDVPPVTEPTRFFVRAVDAADNRSASTSVLTLLPPGSEPTTPAAPSVTGEALSTTSIKLTWAHAGTGVTEYRIARGGQLRGTVAEPGRTFEETGLSPGTNYSYEVVAVGSNGQTSVPGTVSVRTQDSTPDDTTLIAAGSDWRWRYDAQAWPAQWRERTFDDSSWPEAPAVLGFGSTGLATNIDVPPPTSNRPLSAQFRRTFQVADPAALAAVTLTVRADDGVVVYVNGTEVGRENLPTGTLTQTSFAESGPRTGAAAANTVTFVVPRSLLVAGNNVVAASTHLGWRATPDISFDLAMSGLLGSSEDPPPAAPDVSGEVLGATSARLAWTHDADSGVVGYRVSRNGEQVAVVSAPTATYTDTGLNGGSTYQYGVVAIAASGASSQPGTVTLQTPDDLTLIAAGSDWRWRYDAQAWPAQWRERTFDDSSWPEAPAVLGFGSTGLATNIDVPPPTSNRPLSAQFRRTFQVADPSSLAAVTLTVRADDGVVVYVNGTEVGRENLPTGTLTQTSYAESGPRTGAAAANPVTFVVPKSLLVAGNNVVAASTHLGWRATPDISFELVMEAQ